MSIFDPIIKIFDPLVNESYKNYENNYLMYGLIAGFILFLVLIGFLIFKLITKLGG